MLKTMAAMVCGVVVCGSGTASAQIPTWATWQNKIFVNVNGGGTGGANDVNQQFTFDYLLEPATIDTTRRAGGGGLFDFTAGAMVFENWAAGISFSKSGGSSDARFTARIPDSIDYDTFREVSGTIPDMEHSESWFALPRRVHASEASEHARVHARVHVIHGQGRAHGARRSSPRGCLARDHLRSHRFRGRLRPGRLGDPRSPARSRSGASRSASTVATCSRKTSARARSFGTAARAGTSPMTSTWTSAASRAARASGSSSKTRLGASG